MKEVRFALEWALPVAEGIWEMGLTGDTSAITAPGQFVDIALPGKFLRRPISVCDWTEGELILLVKEAGEGTTELVHLPEGTELNVLTGLGNGFDYRPEVTGENPLLIGGGIGIAPLYGLARRLAEEGRKPTIITGFRTESESFYLTLDKFYSREFRNVRVMVLTEDGTTGKKGLVTDKDILSLCRDFFGGEYILACGPTPMLKALHSLPQFAGGQFSFEARMACGFGACVGCTIQTANGPKRVCKDGPVFRKEEILW